MLHYGDTCPECGQGTLAQKHAYDFKVGTLSCDQTICMAWFQPNGQKGVWRPNPGPQESFLACPFFEVLYGGAAGGGKSDALLIDALTQVERSRYRALLIRRSYGELRELIMRSRELYQAIYPTARYNSTEKTWTFPSGATIEFGYLASDDDALQYQGQSYAYVGFDELTHYSEWAYLYLHSRIRSTDPHIRTYVRATANPGGPGHHWVKARFIDNAPPNTPYLDDRTESYRVFIPSRVEHNPYLARTDYSKRLNALPDADRKALREGDWNAYQGSVFDLQPGIHVWDWDQFHRETGQLEIPNTWQRFRVMDWGYARPFAVYWIAVDHKGRGFVYREWYGCETNSRGEPLANTGARMDPEAVAEKIAHIEKTAGESPYGIADPSMWNKGRGDYGGGLSVVEMMGHHQIFWTKANNDRLQGKMSIHDRLRFLEKDGKVVEYPGLIFIKEECPHAIRTIPALEYDKHRVEDIDTTAEDHCLTGDTLVDTENGQVPIKDLVGTTGRLWSWDGGKPVLLPYEDCRMTQAEAEVYEIEMEDGRTIRATINHPFLLSSGEWVCLRDLRPGDDILDVGPQAMI